jgi:hypothetical protein
MRPLILAAAVGCSAPSSLWLDVVVVTREDAFRAPESPPTPDAPAVAPEAPTGAQDAPTAPDAATEDTGAPASDAPAEEAPTDARPDAPVCVNGVSGDCDRDPANGCETDLRATHEHCAVCGFPCHENARCIAGLCVPCPGNTRRCGNACVNIVVDPMNCGACGRACLAGQRCMYAACR